MTAYQEFDRLNRAGQALYWGGSNYEKGDRIFNGCVYLRWTMYPGRGGGANLSGCTGLRG